MGAYVLPCMFPMPYGCWCGITIPFPAEGDPVDKFDQICKEHDYCYERGPEECSFIDEYFWPYSWDLVDEKV
jgi:hypothetical protein